MKILNASIVNEASFDTNPLNKPLNINMLWVNCLGVLRVTDYLFVLIIGMFALKKRY